MKILVTGGAGYIGSILVIKLLDLGYEVTVIDNFLFNQITLMDACKYDNFSILRGDVRDARLMDELIPKFDIIIPLAALVGAPICNNDPVGTLAINQSSIEYLVKISSRDQISNSGYGVGEKNKFCDEETPLNPISTYGMTKVRAEESVLTRENSATFRLATVFGMSNRMRLDLLVNDFVFRAVNDRTLVIFEGHFKRNYIHIQDVARVFIHAINNFDNMKGKPYNVGLEEANLSKIELASVIKKHLPNFVYLEAPIGEDPDKRDYIVSNKRIISSGFVNE